MFAFTDWEGGWVYQGSGYTREGGWVCNPLPDMGLGAPTHPQYWHVVVATTTYTVVNGVVRTLLEYCLVLLVDIDFKRISEEVIQGEFIWIDIH